VNCFSADAPGNAETVKTTAIRIDKSAPALSLDATATYSGPATIRASASDALSGLARAEARRGRMVDGRAAGRPLTHGGARASDVAGNGCDSARPSRCFCQLRQDHARRSLATGHGFKLHGGSCLRQPGHVASRAWSATNGRRPALKVSVRSGSSRTASSRHQASGASSTYSGKWSRTDYGSSSGVKRRP
jgi:hypothetical protein